MDRFPIWQHIPEQWQAFLLFTFSLKVVYKLEMDAEYLWVYVEADDDPYCGVMFSYRLSSLKEFSSEV